MASQDHEYAEEAARLEGQNSTLQQAAMAVSERASERSIVDLRSVYVRCIRRGTAPAWSFFTTWRACVQARRQRQQEIDSILQQLVAKEQERTPSILAVCP